jgi:nitrite reductase (NADH) small subunit
MAEFQKVAKKSEIPVGEMKMVTVNGNDLALCNVEGEIYAIDNNCAHQGGPLSEGILDGKIVTCPWHNWKFDVTSGDCTVNSMANVNCFKIKVEGDDIFVAA